MTDSEKLISIIDDAVDGSVCAVDTKVAILDLFKILIPNKVISKPKFGDELADRHAIGFNRCRSQLLAKIEGMRK